MSDIKIGNKEYNVDDYRVNYKQKQNILDDSIDMHKKSLKNLEKSYENKNLIYKKIGECIDILSASIKGTEANKRYMEMSDNNISNLKKQKNNYEHERRDIVEKLNKIYKQKEDIEKEIKKNNKEKMKEE